MLLVISIGLLLQTKKQQLSWSFCVIRWEIGYVFVNARVVTELFFLLPNAGALGSFSAATYILHQKSTMPGIEINHSETLHIDPKSVREIPQVNDCNDAVESNAQQSHEECMLTEKTTGEQLLDKGCLQFGCAHYRRRCRIRAPCCNDIFDCRHCHNEAKNNLDVNKNYRHDIPRHQVQQVICSLCNTEQEVRQVCINCGVCMGRYFCGTCKLFDDDTSKKQYHCDGCGICRIGGQENFFHCDKCRCCYSVLLKDSHPCVEGAMHHDCPICFEYLFETRNDVLVMPCGHTIHRNCMKEMQEHYQYSCPLCSKSVCDMSKVWERYDMEIAATPMPEHYRDKMVWILCNDCGTNSEVPFHFVAHKCPNCKSYNSRQTRG